jgi:hypothetical protein
MMTQVYEIDGSAGFEPEKQVSGRGRSLVSPDEVEGALAGAGWRASSA